MKKTYIAILLLCLMIYLTGYSEDNTSSDNKQSTSTQFLQENKDSQENMEKKYMHMNADTKVIDVINLPAFIGFGQYLFPTEYGMPESSMKLNNIASLLAYHSHIDTATTVEVLNYMLDEVSSGNIIFYNIYTEKEKKDDPAKENTGLFFFRGNTNAPFAVINAGGGFSYVGSIHESFPHALALSKRGYNAFALQYRTGGVDVACEDLATAISFIFKNAENLKISTACYSLWGGSAGARMAAYLGSYGPSAFGGDDLPRPGTVIMQYTGHTDYTEGDPPTFAVVGENDGIASWHTMERRIKALKSFGIDTEFHKYSNLGHGFGLGIGTSSEGWIEYAIQFWEKHIS